jgi:hypothetical protein
VVDVDVVDPREETVNWVINVNFAIVLNRR